MNGLQNTPTPSEPGSGAGGNVATSWEVDACLARGVLYGALALGLRPPTGESRKRLLSARAGSVLRRAATLVDPDPGGRDLTAAAERLAGLQAEDLEALQILYQRVFGHTARGLVCPFETEYGVQGLFRQPQELADISGYYLAFGLRPRSGAGERGDHAACECEFMDFLNRKEAYALEQGDGPMSETTRKAYRGFVRDHLGRFGRVFAGRLMRADSNGLFGALGALLHALLGLEAARLELPVGREMLELRSTAPDRVPMACGGGEDAGDTSEENGCEGCPTIP
ncbi:MAG: molecular chaperone TorD family protein [Acidobacteria bacterium]|nr:molecular chaperone TorD family protein [Acidobacteriota bacterium]